MNSSVSCQQKCELKIRKKWQVAEIMERIDAIYRNVEIPEEYAD